MNVSEVIVSVETDSIGTVLDTISIAYLKYDAKDRRRYRENIYSLDKGSKQVSKAYFKEDEDLFCLQYYNGDDEEPYSHFEARSDLQGKVVDAIQAYTEEGKLDTFFMDYVRSYYWNGKVKKLLIKTFDPKVGQWDVKLTYNKRGKALEELTTLDGDTVKYEFWHYTDTILNKRVYTSYQFDTFKIISYFRANKDLFKEEQFEFVQGDFSLLKETDHYYNTSGDRVKSIEQNYRTNKQKYISYLSTLQD